LHREIKYAYKKHVMAQQIDDLTAKTLMLMHHTRNNHNHP
jgi:hypothetical protein